jgi:ABC-type antimicrobial peptide transport system permease subunit
VISPGWLQAYGLRLLAGRDLQWTDRSGTPQVALVNEAFLRRFLGNANPVGMTIRVGLLSGPTTVEVVGVVEDAVYRAMREDAVPVVYSSTTQRMAARPFVNVSVVAARGNPLLLSRNIGDAIRNVDPELVIRLVPLTNQMNASMAQERVIALLSSTFAALALSLAAVGLYGVTAFSVNRRRTEIAMRMALGAGRWTLIGFIIRRIAVSAAIGIAAGSIVSLWSAQFAETLVWGLEPRDPATLAAAMATLSTVSILAAGTPAWRAARIDPGAVLKDI